MPNINVSVVGGSHDHKVVPFDAQQTINMYPEAGGKGAKDSSILLRFPGCLPWVDLSTGVGPVRGKGLYEASNHRAFALRGSSLIETATDGTETVRGSVTTNHGPVSFTDNGTQMAIADGRNIYQYIFSTNVLTKVTDSDAPGTTPIIDYVDGYIFAFNPDATTLGEFQHCNLLDVSDWLSTDKYNAESSPDKMVSFIVNNGIIWFFGSKSYEPWRNTGQLTRTWQKIPGAARSIGCGAPHSVAKMGGKIYWLGASKEGRAVVYCSEGFGAKEISDKALEQWINKQTVVDDAIGVTLQFDGHWLYVLTFQTGNRTYAFDLGTREWFRLAYRNPVSGAQGRHLIIASMYFNHKNYIGDYSAGSIHELSLTTYTDKGNPQVCERYFTHIELSKEIIFWERIEFGVEAGVGLTGDGWGSKPYMELRWSNNGGRKFGAFRKIYLGEIGKYLTRAFTERIGRSRNRTYHIRYSHPTPFSLQNKAPARITRGEH